MKQHITIEQLNELSEKGKEKLNKWWEENYKGNTIPGSTDYEDYTNGFYDVPLLSIGQMIEYLDEKIVNLEIKGRRMNESFILNTPNKSMIWDISGGNWNEIEDEYNFCDALWEAVKSDLEK